MLILGFPDSRPQAEAVALELDRPYAEIAVHRFPDGESKITLPEAVAPHIVLFRSLDRPNDKLVELLLASRGLKEAGVRRLTLVAPYLCYLRQDWAFRPGEVVSQTVIGRWLAELFDDVVTVDPHLHRTPRLELAVPARNPVAVAAAGPFARYLAARGGEPLIFGPDAESAQWARAIAEQGGWPWAVAEKTRHGDRSVSIAAPAVDLAGRRVVLVDDIASTGHTLAEAAKALCARGAAEVSVLVTHPVFAGDAVERLRALGIAAIGSSDSIAHPTNVVSLAPVLAAALREMGGA
jgi:ribose-phosphate pyrophosphokinase